MVTLDTKAQNEVVDLLQGYEQFLWQAYLDHKAKGNEEFCRAVQGLMDRNKNMILNLGGSY